MDLLSVKINDLCLKDEASSLKESLVCSPIPIAQRKVPGFENVFSPFGNGLDDVVLLCGPDKHKIFTHRAILASKVPKLNDMIESNNNDLTISLPSVEPSIAEALINFVYSSKLDLTPDKVWDVSSAAEQMGINEILDICQKYIQSSILPHSWLYGRQIALERNSKRLLTTVDNYIFENFPALLQSTDFQQLPRLQVEIINKREDVRHESEGSSEILGLVVDWCKVKLKVKCPTSNRTLNTPAILCGFAPKIVLRNVTCHVAKEKNFKS